MFDLSHSHTGRYTSGDPNSGDLYTVYALEKNKTYIQYRVYALGKNKTYIQYRVYALGKNKTYIKYQKDICKGSIKAYVNLDKKHINAF